MLIKSHEHNTGTDITRCGGRRERRRDRRLEEEERWWFQANPDIKGTLLDSIRGHALPYRRLQHLVKQISLHKDEVRTPKTSHFKKQLKKWMKQFDKLNKTEEKFAWYLFH